MEYGPHQILSGNILDDESPLYEDIQECEEVNLEVYKDYIRDKFPGFTDEVIDSVIKEIRLS